MNIRAVYGTPCRSQYFCKRGNVSGTIDVRVRHVTTLGTDEAVFMPFPQFVAYGARLARVCRIHIIHSYPNTLRLVSHKVLQLSPRPSVQPCTHSFSGFDPVTNMGQVFQTDLGRPAGNSLSNNGFGNNVIYMHDVPAFLARDFTKTLFCASCAVGLKTPTMSEILIPIMPQFSTIKHTTTGCGRDVVFPDINASNTVSGGWRYIRNIQDKVKVPLAFFADQLRFGGRSLRKKIELMWTRSKLYFSAPRHGEQGKCVSLDAVGPLIEVDRLWLENDQRDRFVFADAFIGFKCFIGARHFMDSVTGHLAAKARPLGTNNIVCEVVKGNAVPTTMLLSEWHNVIASKRESISQVFEGLGLFFCVKQLDGYGAFHIG